MPQPGSRTADSGGLIVATSALAVVAGGFLGWVAIPVGDATAAVDGLGLFEAGHPLFNGLVTITLAALVTVVALLLPDWEGVNVATAVAGLSIEVIAVAFLLVPEVTVGTALTSTGGLPLTQVGVGVYVTLVGGLGILLGGFLSYRT